MQNGRVCLESIEKSTPHIATQKLQLALRMLVLIGVRKVLPQQLNVARTSEDHQCFINPN